MNKHGSHRLGAFIVVTACLFLTSAAQAGEPPAGVVSVTQDAGVLCTVPERDGSQPVTPKLKKQALAHLALARPAYEERRFSEALYELRAAYDLNPLVDVLYNLAQVCREAGREEEALHLYEQTQQRSQDAATKEDCQRHIDTLSLKLSAAADQRAAQALLGKDYPGAIAAWESAYKLSKQPAALYRIAAAYRQNGQRKESIAAYERYLASAGGDPNVDKAKTELAALRVEESQPAVTKGDKPGISLVDGGAQPAEAKTPVYKKWWFWTIIGVVAAGAVAGGVAGALARPQTMTVVADPFSDIPAQNQKVLSPQ